MKELDGEAKIIDIYYKYKEKKMTPAEVKRTRMQIRQLLDSGYNFEEIEKALNYIIVNPPPNGFYSFGFLNHVIGEILIKIAIKESKPPDKVSFDVPITQNEDIIESNKDKVKRKNTKVKGTLDF
jgi:hypothetical protein